MGPVTQQERRDGMEWYGMQVLHCKILQKSLFPSKAEKPA